MSVIRWLVMQEICRHFEFARHFESHLTRPPLFYMRIRTTTSDEHSIVTILRSTHIIFSTYLFKATVFTTLITIYSTPIVYVHQRLLHQCASNAVAKAEFSKGGFHNPPAQLRGLDYYTCACALSYCIFSHKLLKGASLP